MSAELRQGFYTVLGEAGARYLGQTLGVHRWVGKRGFTTIPREDVGRLMESGQIVFEGPLPELTLPCGCRPAVGEHCPEGMELRKARTYAYNRWVLANEETRFESERVERMRAHRKATDAYLQHLSGDASMDPRLQELVSRVTSKGASCSG